LGHGAVFKWYKRFAQGREFEKWWAYRLAKNGQNWTQDPRSCNIGACQSLPKR
jgi:hypothetical protein